MAITATHQCNHQCTSAAAGQEPQFDIARGSALECAAVLDVPLSRGLIATGRATCYPVVEDVQTYTVKIVGDDVCITD